MKKRFLIIVSFFCFMMFANQTFAIATPTLYQNQTQTMFQKNYNTLNQYFKAFNDCRIKSNLPKLKSSYIAVKETQSNANSMVIYRIKRLRTAYLKCKKDMPVCPKINNPVCDDGELVDQGKDKNGCKLSLKCVPYDSDNSQDNDSENKSGQEYAEILSPIRFAMEKNQGINQFNSDTADFSVTFRLRAGAENIYINDDTSSNPGLVLKADHGTTTAYACTPFDGTVRDTARHQFMILAGQTAGIQCSVHISPDADGHYIGYISDFIWGIDSDDSTEFHWTPDGANNTARYDYLAKYRSDPMYLKYRQSQ